MKSKKKTPQVTTEPPTNGNILDEKTFKLDRIQPEMANDTNELVIMSSGKKKDKSSAEFDKEAAKPERKKLSKKERKRLEKVLERKEKSQRVSILNFERFFWIFKSFNVCVCFF